MSTYFTLPPVTELGPDLGCAIAQAATSHSATVTVATGFILMRGQRYRRLTECHHRTAALSMARRHQARLGEAVAMVDGRVVYQELFANAGARGAVSGVVKRIDPLTPEGFDRIVDRVARQLRRATVQNEAEAVARAIDRLDVDWRNLSEEGRSAVVRAANRALADLPEVVLPAINEVFELESERVIRGTRGSLRTRFDLPIGSDLTRVDERIAVFVAESQINFIRDEYGRRLDDLGALARDIVSTGAEEGLGRDAISQNLQRALRSQIRGRNAFYWDVVAGAFVNRARSFAEVSAFDESGVAFYQISAVLDEVTSDICRFLDGRVLSVSRAMELFRDGEALRDPEQIRAEQPWLAIRRDDEGRRAIVIPKPDGDIPAATVTDSAELAGRKDDRGTFANEISSRALMDAGVGPPPYHGLCRTVLLPVLP